MQLTRNLTLLTDFYEITMANGYLSENIGNRVSCFDLFFRKIPDNGGFAITAGLEQAIEYLKNLKFSDDDIEYLSSQKIFCDEFLNYLKNFKFSCDIWAIPEGTPVFPGEPIVVVKGPVIQAQFVETTLLVAVNHQSLIATKANRIVRAAGGRPVMEFGARRAQGYDGAYYGARAAYIGGCDSTSCVMAAKEFDIPVSGTMAHSWVQMFDSEYDAFASYARLYPDNCVLLVDTYNTLHHGIPNAIKAFDNVLKPLGYRPKGIRIDSGDITYLSKKARKMLDEAGYPDCHIIASNALDEYIIRDMLIQGARVDAFGVGERLITSSSAPVFGGVYKLSAIWDNGVEIPKIKLSENVAKITTPGFKKTWRLFDRGSSKAIADVITMFDENINDNQQYEIFDPNHVWKRKTINNFIARPLMEQIFLNGHYTGKPHRLSEIRKYCLDQVATLWEEVTRFENPHNYYVDLSQRLWNTRNDLLNMHRK